MSAPGLAEAAPGEQSVVETTAARLREAVTTGQIGPGQRLIEADLVRELGVSRGALREALRVLAAEGILELAPHRGARVRRYGEDELQAIFDVREALEGMAARLAAARAREDRTLPARLLDLTAAMEAATAAGQMRRQIDLNRAFHDVIVGAADNDRMSAMIQQLQLQAYRALFANALDLEDARRSNAEHRLVVDAIAAGDEDGAEAAMRAHIARAAIVIQRATR